MDIRLPEEDRKIIALEYVMYKTSYEVAKIYKKICPITPQEVIRLVSSFGFKTRIQHIRPKDRRNMQINSFNMELLKTKGW